ncbi:MAG TPA: flagellar protein FlaG [bacterium]|nr:flagellar protein FlaG [bacterium]
MPRKVMPVAPSTPPVIPESAKRPNPPVPLISDEMLQTPGRVRDILNLPRPVTPKDAREAVTEQLSRAVEQVNAYLASTRQYTGIRYLTEEKTGLSYAALVNQQTGEVIKRIPPEEILRMAVRVRQASGLFTDQML